MATKILLKKSSVAGRVPAAGDIDYGELAINYADGKIYYKASDNSVNVFLDSAGVETIADARLSGGSSTIRSKFSAVDLGGSGTFSYDSSTGVFSYTGITDTQIHSIFSAGGDLSYDSGTGQFSINVEDIYTQANFDSDLGQSDTDNLPEGSTNLYYTDARVDARMDSARLAVLLPEYATETNTLTMANKTLTNPKFGDSSQLFTSLFHNISLNKNETYGDSAETSFAFFSGDSSRDASIVLGVDNRTAHAIGNVQDRANNTNDLYISVGDNASSIKFTRRALEGNTINWDGETFTGDLLMRMDADGKIHIPKDTNATSRTSAAVTITGGLGVDRDIRAYDVYASGDLRAQGSIIGDVTGTVSDVSNHTTNDIAEGDSNLYYTSVRFDSDFGAKSTDDLSEGTSLYYTVARADSDAKNAISVTDNGGDGSLSYDATTGVISYTGPNAGEVRAHMVAGTGVLYDSSNGVISIGQSVGTSDSVQFSGGTFNGNVTINGNLNISGSQTTNEYIDLRISEPLIKVADSSTDDIYDLGLVGRYSDDGGTTIRRAGFIRDASNGEWYVFAGLIQNGLDSSDPDKTINIDDSSVEYPIWNFGGLRGQYLGFDSDFRAFSTDYTLYESDFTAVPAGRYALDTTNGTFNITLPASPTLGDYIRLIDAGNLTTNSVTLLRNGSTIEDQADDMELDVGQNIIEVLFINNTWQVYAAIGQKGPKGDKGDSADTSGFVSPAQSIAYSIALG